MPCARKLPGGLLLAVVWHWASPEKTFLWVLLAVLIISQGYGKIGGKIVGIGGSVYNHITGYFGDILSYVRLMALMLAGAVIAQVFNTLAAIPGNLIVFIIVSLLGNALNFALNLLGCYVHDMRLQCFGIFQVLLPGWRTRV